MKTALKFLAKAVFILILGLIADPIFAQIADTIGNGGQPVEWWLNAAWQVGILFGIVEVIVRFLTKYRGILGTVIKILVWLEDKTNKNIKKIA